MNNNNSHHFGHCQTASMQDGCSLSDLVGFSVMEIWKDVIGYEGYYQVSNLGNARSLDRYKMIIRCTNCGRWGGENCCDNTNKIEFQRLQNGRNLKIYINAYGYRVVALCMNGKARGKRLSKLVYRAFNGEIESGFQVDHKDNIKTNDFPDNLQLLTPRRNAIKRTQNQKGMKSKYVGVRYRKEGKRHWMAVISINKQQTYLGVFHTQEEARDCYQDKLKTIELSF